MEKSVLTGCLLRYNSLLMNDNRFPVSIECSGEGFITKYENVVYLLRYALEVIGEMTDTRLGLAGKADWQYIGRTYNLYSYKVMDSARNMNAGLIRLVEAGGEFINISGGLEVKFFESLDEYFKTKIVRQGKLVEGKVLEIVFMRDARTDGSTPWGQTYINRQPIYAVEGIPKEIPRKWCLKIRGDVKGVKHIDWEFVRRQSSLVRKGGEFHCVTGWSITLGGIKGLRLNVFLENIHTRKNVGWIGFRSMKGYSTVIPFSQEVIENTYIVIEFNGKPLSIENGFPARVYSPILYGWKSLKWLSEMVLMDRYEDGYWETLGYHERGNVFVNERFKVRNWSIAEKGFIEGRPRPLKPL